MSKTKFYSLIALVLLLFGIGTWLSFKLWRVVHPDAPWWGFFVS